MVNIEEILNNISSLYNLGIIAGQVYWYLSYKIDLLFSLEKEK